MESGIRKPDQLDPEQKESKLMDSEHSESKLMDSEHSESKLMDSEHSESKLMDSEHLESDHAETEGRKARNRVLTEKGLSYLSNIKKGNYDKALKSVQANNKQAVENVSDINTLVRLKAKIEQQLATLERAMCEYAELLPELRRQEVLDIGSRNLESTDELRQWVGEKITLLEADKARSHRSRSSRLSRHTKASTATNSPHALRLKAIAKLAKQEISLKYSRIESQAKIEMEHRKCEMEEIQRERDYEIAKAEVDAFTKMEETSVLSYEIVENRPTNEQDLGERVRKYLSSLQVNESNDDSIPQAFPNSDDEVEKEIPRQHNQPRTSTANPFKADPPVHQPTKGIITNHCREIHNQGNSQQSIPSRVLTTNPFKASPEETLPIHSTPMNPFTKDTEDSSELNQDFAWIWQHDFISQLSTPTKEYNACSITKTTKDQQTPVEQDNIKLIDETVQRPQASVGQKGAKVVDETVQAVKQRSTPSVSDKLGTTDKTEIRQPFSLEHQDITQVIAETVQSTRIPPPTLNVFSGNPIEWPAWKTAFEAVIERRVVSPSERVLYLLQYLAGQPRKIVEGYQFVSSPNAYEQAKKTLEKRFGHPSVVAGAFRKKLEDWERISPRDANGLRDYADFLKTCVLAMQTVDDLGSLSKEHENKKLLKTLPSWTHPKWGLKVRNFQIRHGDNNFPPFADFVNFVTDIADIQCLPVLSNLETNSHPSDGKDKAGRVRPANYRAHGSRTLATTTQEEKTTRSGGGSNACLWCEGPHDLDSCQEFRKRSISTKKQFIIRRGLCFRCLERGHMAKENKCTKKRFCEICKKEHPSCLHQGSDEANVEKPQPKGRPQENGGTSHCTNVCSIEGQQSGQDQGLIVPVWISCLDNPATERLTYALIDCQSNATFITDSLVQELNTTGVDTHLLLSTMHAENEVIECRKVGKLAVQNLDRSINIQLPKVFTRGTIPYSSSQIPKPEVAMQWDHLKCIATKIMPYRPDVRVGLLIGTNCPKAIKPRQIIPGKDNDPYGIKIDLGWAIVGRVCKTPAEDTDEDKALTNKVVVTPNIVPDDKQQQTSNIGTETRAKELITPMKVNEMFEVDFHERKGHSFSQQDRQFIDLMEKSIQRRPDGHYEMPLPLIDPAVQFPDNKGQAMRRLMHLKSRFMKDVRYYKDYVEFMNKITSECAEKVEVDENGKSKGCPGRINYVPHHGVYHSKKNKIRVVFDCSAQSQGVSLNQNLMQGPDLTNSLIGVLCRFREETVAIACDVEGMFHQFFVEEKDRNLLRFLWWENGDYEKDPIEYRMKVHLFGATSSPGCANFAFKKAADDGEADFGPEASNFVKKDFYVDDGLKSVRDPSEARELIENTQALCAKAGLRLHKFASNSKEVILSIPPEDRAKGFQDLDLRCDSLPIERTLGVMWCVETDSFQFRIVIQDRPLTRRGVLSTVSSVYDPLGFVSPLILVGKQILQDLCRENVDWDDAIPDHLRSRWEQWRNELHQLEQIKIQRCFKPKDFGEVKNVELHHFSDASLEGYGQCSYTRLKNLQGRIHCSFAMGKARVTPLKPVTVPRLELTAALVSARIADTLKNDLTYKEIKDVFWTDSQVILGYISNPARRFHIFVANRVQEIHNLSSADQWHYVKTESNPADAASRGLTANQLQDSSWFTGPEFLWNDDVDEFHPQQKTFSADPSDPEVKRAMTTQASEDASSYSENDYLNTFSDWRRARRIIAYCLRFVRILKSRLESSKGKDAEDLVTTCKQLSVDELSAAERTIIGGVQQEYFKDELKTIASLKPDGEFIQDEAARKRNASLKPSSNLYRLDPFIDENGILRVGGRLRRADMPWSIKHPIILPKEALITRLVIESCHKQIQHQGRGMTHNELRQQGYWIIGGSTTVANAIYKCVTCRRLRSPVQEQKMADLPVDRIQPSPPFTYSAVDYFGPFLVKEGRKEVKRYGVLFTCMASRAVHIETSNTLDTDSFINALRRFQAERGPVRQMRSDRGTNFVGANTDLTKALKELDQEKIGNFMSSQNCDWVEFRMNVPSASHMGGVWERQIRSVRSVLAALLLEAGSQLDDEGFRTLMKEVQCIINSRPLTTTDSSSLEPITPNHLLTMKGKVLMPPPGNFTREDIYSRKRWRRVQHLANQFWFRWRREFLQTLQTRKKWLKPRRNLQEGDVVLVKDDNLPRNQWRLGRVHETYPSEDRLVRKVKLAMATSELDKNGRRLKATQYLERPIQKLVLLLTKEEDRGIPTKEPSKNK